MGCIVKLKLREEYLTFNSLEEAKKYIKEHKLEIAKDLKTWKDDPDQEYLTFTTQQEKTEKIIREAHTRAFAETREQLTRVSVNGWNSEVYSKNSDAFGISTFLSGLVVDGKRLFPEFITDNYLNVLIQNAICKESLIRSGNANPSSDEINNLRKNIFDDTLSASANDAKLKTAKEWLEYFNTKVKTPLIIDDETLNSFDTDAQAENDKNFESMLRGEIIHAIFEGIVKGHSLSSIKANVEKLFIDDFIKKYGDDYTEVPNSLNIISKVHDTINDKYDDYYKSCQKAFATIKSSFKGKDVKFLTEHRVTANLSEAVNIGGLSKSKIRGKMDLIAIVDGVPHIIDLKVSNNPIADWHIEKRMKTEYQLAAYYRLLNHIGLNTSTSTVNVFGFTIDNNGDIIDANSSFVDWTSNVVFNQKINKTLSKLFSIVEREEMIDIEMIDRVSDYTKTLFGEAPAISQKKYTEEKFQTSLRERAKLDSKTGKWMIFYSLYGDDGKLTDHVEKVDANKLEDKIKELAKKVYEAYTNRFENMFNQFLTDVDAYLAGRKTIDEFACVGENTSLKNQMTAILMKYRGDAKIIYPEIGRKFNMIFIQTPIGIDVIKCTHLSPDSAWDSSDKNAKLFSSSGLNTVNMKKTVGNVQIVDAMLILNELIAGSTQNVGDITCLQLGTPHAYKMTKSKMEECSEAAFSILNSAGKNIFRRVERGRFVDPFKDILYAFTQFIDSTTGEFHGKKIISKKSADNDSTNILSAILKDPSSLDFLKDNTTYLVEDKLIVLKMLRDDLLENFSEYFKDVNEATNIIVDEVTLLRYMIENAIAIYENREFIVESDISKYGVNGGYMMSSMDLMPEENMQIINRTVQIGFDQVRTRFAKYRSECSAQVAKLKEANGFGKVRQIVVGDTTSNYTNLFERDESGNLLDGDLKFRNPWTDDRLTPHEKEFLKYVLFTLNKRKYKWKTINDIDKSKLKPEDFLCPLMRTKGMDRFRDPNGGINFPFFSKEYMKETYNRIQNKFYDLNDVLEGQVEERRTAADTLNSMYNEFNNRTNPEIRAQHIATTGGIAAFSMDVETILHTFELANDMEEIFNLNVLPQIRSVMYVSLFQANITGMKMPNLREFVREYTKSAVYGDAIVNPEVQKFFKVIGPLRQAGAAVALSYNVMNVPRELIMGFFTNISRAMFGSYGEETFTLKDYMKAFGIVGMDAPNFMMNTTKIELMNELYGLSNMSINEIPEQVTSNKTGVWALGSRWMSWSLVAPDYYNRMTMFIAQMIHDGCWEAHELKTVNGVKELVYNMEKDKRFDVYAKYKGDFSKVPDNLKIKFNEQAALYEVMRDEFNKELEIGQRITTDKYMPLPRAYTNLQRNSMKSFADMSFGYYDRETKAHFFKTAIGLTFKQFMAYLSAKKMRYFQERSDTTSRGSFKQLTDTHGNKIWTIILEDGTKQNITDEELNTTYKEYKTIAKPKLVWQGTYMEGIFQSYLNLIKELYTGTKEFIKGDGTETFKRLWREYGKKGDIRHSNLLEGLYDLLLTSFFMALLNMLFLDDPESTGISYKEQLKDKSSIAQNLYWAADGAMRDFSIINAIDQFVFTWEIPSWNILQSSVKRFFNSFGDEDLTLLEEAINGTVNSVGAFKIVRPIVEDWIEE